MFFGKGDKYAYKPAAAIVSCRRGGASASFDRLNKYFTISNMPVVSSQYWNAVHGTTPDEVRQDLEGMQIMRTLGKNMAWLSCIQAAKGTVPYPVAETRMTTASSRDRSGDRVQTSRAWIGDRRGTGRSSKADEWRR
jgi:hypothetical protein